MRALFRRTAAAYAHLWRRAHHSRARPVATHPPRRGDVAGARVQQRTHTAANGAHSCHLARPTSSRPHTLALGNIADVARARVTRRRTPQTHTLAAADDMASSSSRPPTTVPDVPTHPTAAMAARAAVSTYEGGSEGTDDGFMGVELRSLPIAGDGGSVPLSIAAGGAVAGGGGARSASTVLRRAEVPLAGDGAGGAEASGASSERTPLERGVLPPKASTTRYAAPARVHMHCTNASHQRAVAPATVQSIDRLRVRLYRGGGLRGTHARMLLALALSPCVLLAAPCF